MTTRKLDSPILFFTLIGLYPVVFLVSKNWFAYDTDQLTFLLIIPCTMCFIGLLIVGLGRLIRLVILTKAPIVFTHSVISSLNRGKVQNVITSTTGFLLLYLLLEKTITESKALVIGFTICTIITGFLLVRKTGFYFINLIILFMILFSTGELVISTSSNTFKDGAMFTGLNKEMDSQVKFMKTPNIYLIHLESYHSPAAMQRLYNFSNQDFIDRLNNTGFYISRASYTNYPTTLTSIAAMFLQQHHYYKYVAGLDDAVGIREMIGGSLYNPTLAILKNNGYKIYYLHTDDYIFRRGASSVIDYRYPTKNISESFSIFQSAKVDWLRSKFTNLQELITKKVSIANRSFSQTLWDKLEDKETLTQPHFFYIKYSGAGHTSPSKYTWEDSEKGWAERYQERVKSANPGIISLVNKIIRTDPNGVIILYGDHGAWRYRGIWGDNKEGKEVNKLIYERGKITGEDLALDLFGAFLAVRYPNGNSALLEGETHVNIFRKLFSDLAQSDTLLKDKPANESYLIINKKLHVLVKDGKALQQIEVVP